LFQPAGYAPPRARLRITYWSWSKTHSPRAVEPGRREVVEERGAVGARLVGGERRVRGCRAAARAPDLELVEGVAELGRRRGGVVEGAA
jgi:hypothetical protein